VGPFYFLAQQKEEGRRKKEEAIKATVSAMRERPNRLGGCYMKLTHRIRSNPVNSPTFCG